MIGTAASSDPYGRPPPYYLLCQCLWTLSGQARIGFQKNSGKFIDSAGPFCESLGMISKFRRTLSPGATKSSELPPPSSPVEATTCWQSTTSSPRPVFSCRTPSVRVTLPILLETRQRKEGRASSTTKMVRRRDKALRFSSIGRGMPWFHHACTLSSFVCMQTSTLSIRTVKKIEGPVKKLPYGAKGLRPMPRFP